jgi:hypothetical protein
MLLHEKQIWMGARPFGEYVEPWSDQIMRPSFLNRRIIETRRSLTTSPESDMISPSMSVAVNQRFGEEVHMLSLPMIQRNTGNPL